MVRTSLFACVLLVLVTGATPAPASADESRGYVPYDGWVRGTPAYHGFTWRDSEVAGTDARRPDFTQVSGFDKSALRLKYPLYRDPAHPVHRVATPACTGYVWPVRTDIQLCASGVPEIPERCIHHHRCDRCGKEHCHTQGCAKHRCGKRHHCGHRHDCGNRHDCAKRSDCAKRTHCAPKGCSASACGQELGPPAAQAPAEAAPAAGSPSAVEGD